MMILVMMTSTLAGCTGGDPDDGGEIDNDVLNDLIDQNLQDFINNTTITVNQEIHHHNNTTVVNNYYSTNNDFNNTTVIEGGEVTNQNYDQSNTYYNASSVGGNGTSNGIVHTIDYVFDLDFLWGDSPIIPGDRNNIYMTNWSYYDYATNDYRNDVFTFNCGIYYLIGNSSTNNSNLQTYWENNHWYDDAWSDNGYNNTMRDLFHNVAWNEDLRWVCDENFYGNDDNQYYNELIYEFTIPEGFAMKCLTEQSRPLIYKLINATTPTPTPGVDANGDGDFDDEGDTAPSLGDTAPSGENNYEWTVMSQLNTMYVDGMQYYCDNEMPLIGGEKDMVVSFSAQLQESHDYRLIWAYQLILVISHDYTDLED
jgi:hypothetical protein